MRKQLSHTRKAEGLGTGDQNKQPSTAWPTHRKSSSHGVLEPGICAPLDFRYHHGICLQGLRKSAKALCLGTRFRRGIPAWTKRSASAIMCPCLILRTRGHIHIIQTDTNADGAKNRRSGSSLQNNALQKQHTVFGKGNEAVATFWIVNPAKRTCTTTNQTLSAKFHTCLYSGTSYYSLFLFLCRPLPCLPQSQVLTQANCCTLLPFRTPTRHTLSRWNAGFLHKPADVLYYYPSIFTQIFQVISSNRHTCYMPK